MTTIPVVPEMVPPKARRTRFQQPQPHIRGDWAYLLLWQDEAIKGQVVRKRKRVKLGLASMPKKQLQRLAADHLRKVNESACVPAGVFLFEHYVQQVYVTTNLPLLAKSSQDRYIGVIENYLLPAFGEHSLRDLTALAIQRYFTGLGKSDLSFESQEKVRIVLSAILASAARYDYLPSNPVRHVRLMRGRRGKRVAKPWLTPGQFLQLIALIPEPYASMVFVAVLTGLRPGELIALRWRNVDFIAETISVEERCTRGDWGAPKSEASNAVIPVNRLVLDRLEPLKTLTIKLKAGRGVREYRAVKQAGPDDLVFQSVVGGRPMRDNNTLARWLKPAARQIGLPWVNWRSFRRTYSMWLKLAGAHVRDASGMMRHSRASTTMDIYQQDVPDTQRLLAYKVGELISSAELNGANSSVSNSSSQTN